MTTPRQIIVPSDIGDVPPHEHDATEISGVFNFLRALKVIIQGDLKADTWDGANQVPGGGATVGFFLDSSSGAADFREVFTGNLETADLLLLKQDDVNEGGQMEYEAAGSNTAGVFTDRFAETWRVIINAASPLIAAETYVAVLDGSAAAPSVRRAATADGLFLASGVLGVAIGGSEVARFNATGMTGAVNGVDALDEVVSGFTNTSFADLDDLSTAAFARGVAVTVTTGTEALVISSTSQARINTSGVCSLSYRVSGATTITADSFKGARTDDTNNHSLSYVHHQTGLTAGSNTFELQAAVTANSGVIRNPSLTVIPL